MSGFTEIREQIADVLADDSQYQTFPFPPMTPMANSIAIEPGSPWVTPLTVQKGVMTNWTIRMYANVMDNQNDLITLENMVTTVLSNIPSWAIFSEVSQPTVIDLTTNLLTTCDITLSVAVNIEE